MKIVRTLFLMAVWTFLYYLAGVFITSDWDTSKWDEAAKFVSLVFVWLPGIVVCGIAYIDVILEERS
jgi:hypothetical protein